jgi:hypothetical protein
MNNVSQGKYKILHKSYGPLETAGLATCSAISFMINNTYNFMAHIDANTNINTIVTNIQLEFLNNLHITNIKIYYGSGFGGHTSEITEKLIQNFTKLLNIDMYPKKENPEDIIKLDDIIQCKKCGSRSGTLKMITHYYDCEYAFKVFIRKTGFMETVYS